jgi:hypothetical protein
MLNSFRLKAGATSVILPIFIQDASNPEAGKTALAFGDVRAYYKREKEATPTEITVVTMTAGTWASGGFVKIDDTNLPGWYEFGVPNAVLAKGTARYAFLSVGGAADMYETPIYIELEP